MQGCAVSGMFLVASQFFPITSQLCVDLLGLSWRDSDCVGGSQYPIHFLYVSSDNSAQFFCVWACVHVHMFMHAVAHSRVFTCTWKLEISLGCRLSEVLYLVFLRYGYSLSQKLAD